MLDGLDLAEYFKKFMSYLTRFQFVSGYENCFCLLTFHVNHGTKKNFESL